jgi:hypothetical protein
MSIAARPISKRFREHDMPNKQLWPLLRADPQRIAKAAGNS